MLTLLLIILISGFLIESYLDYLNIKNWSPEIPDLVKDVYPEDKYAKAREYARANYSFSFIVSVFSFVVMLVVLLTGFFGIIDNLVRSFTNEPVWIAFLFFGIIGLLSDFISIPFTAYKIFVIEEKFGFNKTSIKTFIQDKLKGYLLALIIGGLLLFVLFKIFELTENNFWWIAWIFMTVFMLLATVFYTSWILPLFNKLTPLPPGELRNAIESYSIANNFPLNDIYVMDGSKRSSKANAFFSGLGKKKKIVLFDTLIKEHSTDELVAVLAHETGHYKLKHTTTSVVAGIFQTGLMLFIFSLIQGNPELSSALGAQVLGLHLELLAFGILYTPISSISGIFMHMLSRKNEFEADAFAGKTFNSNALIIALKKLSADNLSNPTPHPAYVFVHYSHPPLLKRIQALMK